MQEKTQQEAADYLAQNHRRRTWKKIISILACIVVFCTTYALILPAITLENHTTYCGLEEHQHGLECYERTLICGQEETDVTVHAHTDGCYASEDVLKCALKEGEEIPGHTHTDKCYESVLTCRQEEHTHKLSCYSDPEADLESPEDWSRSVSCVKLTGNWRSDLIAVAESQLGYTESSRNYRVDEDGETKKGYTRYGEWYGDPYGDWDAMFVSFCLDYAGVKDFPLEASCPCWTEILQKEEYGLYRTKEAYTPKAGDLIFLDTDGNSIADHVGLVMKLLDATETEPARLRTIEGNSDNCVQYADYNRDDARILGYGELLEEPRVEYRWSQGGMEVLLSVPQDEELPEDAELVVERLTPENDGSGYGEKYAASQEEFAAKEATAISYFDLFQVSLQAEGKKVLPQKEATLEIRLLEDEYPVRPHMEFYHYSENGTAAPASNLHEEAGSLTGSFATKLSGEYAVVGAADVSADAPPVRAQDTREASTITPHKTIDAFRDGVDNPDTTLDNTATDKTDLYRLYLDAELSGQIEPIDLLIVADQSGSMHMDYDSNDTTEQYKDMQDEAGNAIFRDQAVRLVLNGTDNIEDRAVYEANKKKGLIYQFLAANDENNVAVVGFQGIGQYGYYADYDRDNNTDAETILEWTSDPQRADIEGQRENATNYCAGFLQADRMLDDPAVANNGHKKVILFLSDGIPTCHIASKWGGYYRGGTGNSTNTATANTTDQYFNELRTNHPDVIIDTVSIRAGDALTRLQSMADAGGGYCYSVNKTEDLKTALKKLMFGALYSNLAIEDTLSLDVDLYDGQPDFKVTLKEADGTVKVLYENKAITSDGTSILASVSYHSGTRKVSAVFVPTYTPKPGSTITLSFNVKTSQSAYQKYAKEGYQEVTGNANTDYNGNATSSGQGGFPSNALAQVTYWKDGVADSQKYPHPVVQAVTCKVVIQKTDSRDSTKMLSGAEFTLYREAFAGETGVTLDGQDGSYVMVGEKLTTDKNGQLIMDNLIPGDYCLVETKAPDHYRKLTAPVPFTLSRKTDGTGQIEGSDLTITVDEETLPALWVPNIPWDHELPQTGGIGSVSYTAGGLLLTAAAILLLYKKKKRRREDFASS